METKVNNNRDLLCELGHEGAIVFENPEYDDAIIGIDSNDRVVYDFGKMVEHLMDDDGMSYEDAVEFIEYNTIRAIPYAGPNAPIVVYSIDDYQEDIDIKPYAFDAEKEKKAIVEWIKDWFERNGKGCNAVIGLSGGKDSTIAAALCVEALGKDRVIGVGIPDKGQSLNDADKIAEHLGIRFIVYPINKVTDAMAIAFPLEEGMSQQTKQNIPPRARMMVLYALSQTLNGRVVGTCNLSENYIGYFTKYGDGAADFEPLGNLTVTEVRAIGHTLGIPAKWVDKTPDDGLPMSCPDEEKFGFSYETLDKYIRFGICDDDVIRQKIEAMNKKNLFKLRPVEMYKPTWE